MGRHKGQTNKSARWPVTCLNCGVGITSINASNNAGRRPYECKTCATNRIYAIQWRQKPIEKVFTEIENLTKKIKILEEIRRG